MKPIQSPQMISLEEIPDESLDDYELLTSFVQDGQRIVIVERRSEKQIHLI